MIPLFYTFFFCLSCSKSIAECQVIFVVWWYWKYRESIYKIVEIQARKGSDRSSSSSLSLLWLVGHTCPVLLQLQNLAVVSIFVRLALNRSMFLFSLFLTVTSYSKHEDECKIHLMLLLVFKLILLQGAAVWFWTEKVPWVRNGIVIPVLNKWCHILWLWGVFPWHLPLCALDVLLRLT